MQIFYFNYWKCLVLVCIKNQESFNYCKFVLAESVRRSQCYKPPVFVRVGQGSGAIRLLVDY